MPQPLVAVIIVTWNNSKDITECLTALFTQSYENFKVLVVDNNSQDNTVEIVRTQFPQVDLHALKQNLYFAGGNNFGFEQAMQKYQPEFMAILNPDTKISPDWLNAQIELMQNDSRIGVIGPKVLFAEGFGTLDIKSTGQQKVINTAGILPGGFLFPYDRGFGEADKGQYEQTEDVYAVSGVSMLFRSEALKQVGYFFAPMQMYLEDVDLCLRLRKAGWRVVYTAKTELEHKHMQSTQQSNKGNYFYWSRRNYLLLIWRHYSLRKLLRATRIIFNELRLIPFIIVILSFFRIKLFHWANR